MRLRRALGPTFLGVLYSLCSLGMWTIVSSTAYTRGVLGQPESARKSVSIGAGAITIETAAGVSEIHYNWILLLAPLIVCYVLGATAARLVLEQTTFKRPQLVHICAALGLVLMSFLAAIGASQAYWGYTFKRPDPPKQIEELRKVSSVVIVETPDSLPRKLTLSDDESFDRLFKKDSEFPYYYLEGRILGQLKERRLLPVAPSADSAKLDAYLRAFRNASLMTPGEASYKGADRLRGIIVEGIAGDGSRLVLFGLRSGEVANDHYAFSESVFRAKPGTEVPSLESSQKFFYDFAGWEHVEWPAFLVMLGLPILGFGYALFLVFDFVGRGWVSQLAKRLRGAAPP